MTLRTPAALLAVSALALVAAPASANAATLTLTGSTSVFPLMKQLATAYNKQTKTQFRIGQGSSDVGINDAARGRVSFGMSSRDPQPSDPGGLRFNRVARDGVCIVTHPSNPLTNISRATIQAVFAGRVRNWSQVPGAKATGPIDLVTRTPASGTADAFQNIFMGVNLRVLPLGQKSTNGLVQQEIRSNRSAMGYIDFKFTAGTAVVPFEGVPCNLRNAKSGQYQGLRNFWLVSRGAPGGAGAKFLRWVKSSAGQRIVGRGWVSLR